MKWYDGGVDQDSKPRLRSVEAFPVEAEGGKALALRDPEGLTSSVVLVPFPLLPIVELFDGAHTAADVARELERPGDEALIAKVLETAAALEEKLMLESPRVEAERARLAAEYAAAPERPAAHAGRAYPAEPEKLSAELSSYFRHAEGPGQTRPTEPGPLKALVAPHIDYRRGGPAYAWAYRELGEGADVYFILGTCHAGLSQPFAAARKSYATPFGTAQTDVESAERLARASKLDLFSQEAAHRLEHSIELQAVFLKHAAPKERPFKIVPILASYCHELMAEGLDPRGFDALARFSDALREELARPGRRACLIVGADLAHMGTQFGDASLTKAEMEACAAADLALLRSVEAVDAPGFFAGVADGHDNRRICGFSPIHLALTTLAGTGARGRLLKHGYWPDPEGLVSYASLSFR